jgi:hypothetical protein
VRAEIEEERLRKLKEIGRKQHLQPKKEGCVEQIPQKLQKANSVCGEQIPHKQPERTLIRKIMLLVRINAQ